MDVVFHLYLEDQLVRMLSFSQCEPRAEIAEHELAFRMGANHAEKRGVDGLLVGFALICHFIFRLSSGEDAALGSFGLFLGLLLEVVIVDVIRNDDLRHVKLGFRGNNEGLSDATQRNGVELHGA